MEKSTKSLHTINVVYPRLTTLEVQYAVTTRFYQEDIHSAAVIVITIHTIKFAVKTRFSVNRQELHVVGL